MTMPSSRKPAPSGKPIPKSGKVARTGPTKQSNMKYGSKQGARGVGSVQVPWTSTDERLARENATGKSDRSIKQGSGSRISSHSDYKPRKGSR